MTKETEMVYEVRCGGRVLAQFSTERKAKSEMRRLRKDGMDEARVYSKWVPVSKYEGDVKPKRKGSAPTKASGSVKGPAAPSKATFSGKARQDTSINEWLAYRGLKPVLKDMTFQRLFECVVVDLQTLEEAVGECNGRKKALIEGIVEAMDHPSISVRYIEKTLEDTAKRRRALSRAPAEMWLDSLEWEVSRDAATELQRRWQSLKGPLVLAAFRNGGPCEQAIGDSDLSVQPTESGLALCYREVNSNKVYFVLKDIQCVEITGDRIDIFGSLKDGTGAVRTFGFRKAIEKPKGSDGPPFREGWYRINRGFLVFVQISSEPLEEEYRKDYDRYIDYSVVYPQFDSYDYDGGFIAYRDSMGIAAFMREQFGATDIDYVDVEDPWELREAFESNDVRYLAKAISRYPNLGVFR